MMSDDQAWFWTPEWQAGEREAEEAIARGEYKHFETVEEAIAWLTSGGEMPALPTIRRGQRVPTKGDGYEPERTDAPDPKVTGHQTP